MGNIDILNEIMLNAKEIPIECQERILDILKGMAFTKRCLLNPHSKIKEQVDAEKSD
ncbi:MULTISPECIES: hypothetical protein [Clostridium]|uniref:hypothetical protein n=1 Tax=Clostridium TaxID=1485 RepID=UPI0015E6B0B3|nr:MULTISPECIES: hypothetical protein [Clostridium]